MKSYAKSAELHARACNVLAGGVSSEFRKFNAPHPLFYQSGNGARITDVDGNTFLDFTLSQGPLILGHSHPHVLESVARYSAEGQLFAGQHLLELKLAEKLQSLIPCAERLRFCLSGSEADHTALRIARAATGRTKIIRFEGHYHGWFDNVLAGSPLVPPDPETRASFAPLLPSQGIPDDPNVLMLPWNDLATVERVLAQHKDSVAAIITEPVMCNHGCIPPEKGFLAGLRALADASGALLIFDEVITGFRLSMGGAQQYFGVVPDLAVFGKAMASGYPISIICGKQKFMDLLTSGKVVHAGTMNSGNPCIAAAYATIEVLEREQVHERLFRLGHKLMTGLQDAARAAGRSVLIQGMGPMFHMSFTNQPRLANYRDTLRCDKPAYAAFVLAMQERGIRLIGRGLWYISAAHTDADIEECLQAAREALR